MEHEHELLQAFLLGARVLRKACDLDLKDDDSQKAMILLHEISEGTASLSEPVRLGPVVEDKWEEAVREKMAQHGLQADQRLAQRIIDVLFP